MTKQEIVDETIKEVVGAIGDRFNQNAQDFVKKATESQLDNTDHDVVNLTIAAIVDALRVGKFNNIVQEQVRRSMHNRLDSVAVPGPTTPKPTITSEKSEKKGLIIDPDADPLLRTKNLIDPMPVTTEKGKLDNKKNINPYSDTPIE